MTIAHLSPQQDQIRREMNAIANRFDANLPLRGAPDAVNFARELLARAAEGNLPAECMVRLQLVVSAYDKEAALPEHLRGAWFRPSRN